MNSNSLLNTNSAIASEGSSKPPFLRTSGMKRKAESNDGSFHLKKPKVGVSQRHEHPTSNHGYDAVQPSEAVSTRQNCMQRAENEYFALETQKAAPATKAMIQEPIPPPLSETIPRFDETVVSTNANAMFAPNNLPNGASAGNRILESSSGALPSQTTSTLPKMNIKETISSRGLCLAFDDETSALYGEMVYFLTGFGVIPTYGLYLYRMEEDDPRRAAAAYVYFAMIFGPFMSLLTILRKDIGYSRLSFISSLGFSIVSNLTEWPHERECTITALCHGNLIFCVMANLSLSFREKVIRIIITFVVGSFVSIHSPYSEYFEDTFPVLGGTSLMCIFFLYIAHYGLAGNLATAQAARLTLGALFVQHAIYSATSSDLTAYESIMSLVKGAFIVSVGIAAAGTVQDEILQKERLERMVQQRTKKLHMVNLALQASETAIAITDQLGNIIWVNAEFERISGENEEGLHGRSLKDTIYKLDKGTKENKYVLMESYENASVRSERELRIGDCVYHLDATPFSSEGFNKQRIDQNDRFLMVFKDITAGHARDIAEKKAEEEAVLAKAMSESMVSLTHELRTPLQGIMGVASLLLQQASDLSSDVVESLRLIMGSSTLLLNLINNLLDVKKANAKMMEDFQLAAIPAQDQIKDAVCFCQPLAFISKVNIVANQTTDKKLCVRSNALRLQQILINFISNAIKYTKRGSDITIEVEATSLGDVRRRIESAIASTHNVNDGEGENDESKVLVFSVSDCGPGIARDQAGLLFQRYAQLESRPTRSLGTNTAGQPSGTGVGLHLCQMFVNRMNGQIWAANNRGDGCTFSFYLPFVCCDASDSVPEVAASAWAPDSRSTPYEKQESEKKVSKTSGFDYRVLLVDDTLINRKVFDRMLQKIGVSHAVSVDSGEKALQELSRNSYDLVMTDLQMPGMSGEELSAAIRESCNGSTPPVVVGLTADISGEALERCVESGMADLVYKPITILEMRDYFERTVPHLKPGIWYKATIRTSSPQHNCGYGTCSDDGSLDGGGVADEEEPTNNAAMHKAQ